MFSHNQKVKFSNCDPGGVIYFAEVFDIAHQAYEEFLQQIESDRDYFTDEKIALPVVNADASYKSPINLHDQLNIILFVSDLRDSSFELTYEIFGQDDVSKAIVKTVHVCIDKNTGTKSTLPEELRKHLNTNLGK